MEGRILNRSLLQKVADMLNLEGVKRFPSSLDLSDIKAVVDISKLAQAGSPLASSFYPRHDIVPIDVNIGIVGFNVVGSSAATFASQVSTELGISAIPEYESRLMHAQINVSYAAAGAAADAAAGVYLMAVVTLVNPTGQFVIALQEVFSFVDGTSPYGYSWTYPQGSGAAFDPSAAGNVINESSAGKWDGYIPPGWSCCVLLYRKLGTGFFPLLTTMTDNFLVAQRLSRGDWKA